MSEASARDIVVEVDVDYVPARSLPQQGLYFFSYHITIRNEGSEPVQLLSRYWHIVDGVGRVEEVRGPGVVGEQPRIAPGKAYSYISFCPLPTQIGTMRGSYQMVTEEGDEFDVQIPAFTLAAPHALN